MKDYPYVPGWRQNKENNKPAIKHSVLMFTTHGIAEGEWVGNEWVQYRWSCKVKDTEVLYWMHLKDLTQLEKERDCLQQERPDDVVVVARAFLDALSKTPYNNKPITDAQIIVKQLLLFFENPKEYNPDTILEQPELDLEKEIKDYIDQQPLVAAYGGVKYQLIPPAEKIARHFYELGLKARKDE